MIYVRYISVALFAILLCVVATAQIPLRTLPNDEFEERITAHVESMEIVDIHEHLMPQESVKNSTMLDFMLLLHHYADDDIKSAGMEKQQFAELLTDKYTIHEKWERVKPYWEASKNTAYGRTVLLAIDKLWGIDDLTDETYEAVSEKLKASYQMDWYDEVLKEKAKIKYAIMDVGANRRDDDIFRYVEKFDEFIRINSPEDIAKISKKYGQEINDLQSLTKVIESAFEQAVKRNIAGIKSAAAYHRILHYENASKAVAEKALTDLLSGHAMPDFDSVKPLQDYMMHQIIKLARRYDLPMQIHTGLQAGDGNIISNANPAHLSNLFLEYRDVKFLLMHGSYPYGGELSALAKNLRNVYLDASWMYIISPSYSERYLHEWLETVPANKILAFGGDYHNVENTYAHSLMARAVVSKVLIEKVATGYLTEAEALQIADLILRENAISFFEIE